MDTEHICAGRSSRDDFITTLLFDKSQGPLSLELGELVTEAQSLFNAVGENTKIALTNIIWLLVQTPTATKRLR
jgi:cytochrome P450